MTELIAVLLLYAALMMVVLVAVIRVITTDSERWTHGRLSKAAWIVACVWLTVGNGHFAVPVGAIAAIWHTHKLNQTRPDGQPDVPFAEGIPWANASYPTASHDTAGYDGGGYDTAGYGGGGWGGGEPAGAEASDAAGTAPDIDGTETGGWR